MSSIFINYRSSDTSSMAEFLDDRLGIHFGPDQIFRDDRSLPVGLDYRERLMSHLRLSRVMLVLIGRHWLETDEVGVIKLFKDEDAVREEIAEALQRNMMVIPILVGSQSRISADALPDSVKNLAYRQYRHVRDRSAKRDIDALIVELEKAGVKPLRHDPPPAANGGRVIQIRDINNHHGGVALGDGSPVYVGSTGHPQPGRPAPQAEPEPGDDDE